MSIKCMTSVWEQSQHKGSALLLLLAIADYADDLGVAWPAHATLARKTRMSRRHIIRLADQVSETGELWILNRERTSNVSIVTVGLTPAGLEAAAKKALSLGVIAPRGSDNLSPPPQVLVVTSCHPPSDNLSPPPDNLSPMGDTDVTGGVTSMSHDPSLNRQLSVIETEEDLQKIWTQARALLKLQMTQATYTTHLQSARLIPSDNGAWQLQVKADFNVGWVANRLAPLITKTLAHITGEERDLEVVTS